MSDIFAIVIPKWGLTMDEGTLNEWIVRPGEDFAKGDVLCEVESSKIVNDVEAARAGTLRRVLVEPSDEMLPVGTLLAVAAAGEVSEEEIDRFVAGYSADEAGAGEDAGEGDDDEPAVADPDPVAAPADGSTALSGAVTPDAPGSEVAADTRDAGEATPHAADEAGRLGVDLGSVTGTGRLGRITVADVRAAARAAGIAVPERGPAQRSGGGRSVADDSAVPASPHARDLAARLGINLHDCRATARQGRVGVADVELVAYRRGLLGGGAGETPAAAAAPEQAPAAAASPADARVPLTPLQEAAAGRLQASVREAPHFRLSADLVVDRLLDLRERLDSPDAPVSVNDVLLKAVATALARFPQVSATFDAETGTVTRRGAADIAMAVAVADGLVTPVLRGADALGIREIAAATAELAGRAREGRLSAADQTGGSFTVSNLGMFGVDRFDAIINPPQVAILAVGWATERVVVGREGEPVVARVATVTLSCDHRVVDGATGARFLDVLRPLVEDPATMLG